MKKVIIGLIVLNAITCITAGMLYYKFSKSEENIEKCQRHVNKLQEQMLDNLKKMNDSEKKFDKAVECVLAVT